MFQTFWSLGVWVNEHSLLILTSMIVLTVIATAVYVARRKNVRNETAINHGKTDKDLKHAKPGKGGGLIFGKDHRGREVYLPAGSEGHVLCIGGSGCGKTSSILIPSVEAFNRAGGTSFAIDISNDITHALQPILKERLIVFDPWSETNGVKWDVFASLDKCSNIDQRLERIEQLAQILMPMNADASSAARYYQDSGRAILIAVLLAFAQDLDFCSICRKIVETPWRDLFNEIDSRDKLASSMLNGFAGVSDANIAGCFQNLVDAVKPFARGVLSRKFGRGGVTPEDLMDRSITLCVPDDRLKISQDMLALVSSQVLEYFSARSNDDLHSILFALDEFASLGQIEIVDALRKYRKKHINILICTQSLSDLISNYGKDITDVMYNNFKYKAILQVSDHETQNRISLEVGEVKSISISTTEQQGGGAGSVTRSETTRRVIEPSVLATLPARESCLLVHPSGVMTLAKNYYFKNKHFFGGGAQ